ncbi:hypothetical protein FEM03_07955 [Phragmitibacter flavus]|uniref:HEAT repeat domain-containing protein n=1 Tax=Phragmitibacter flavus TaxID=2576071 RepID=A0A5R8KGN0_9BACT|nr:hypothetical protein [Phragmitibacter flavus]TLD71450.1 hypothetical protein FEM03_07955 [Phragmitibacter flavus]
MPRRKPLLADDDDVPVLSPSSSASAAPAPAPTSYIVKTNRPTNQRRGGSILKLLGLILLCNLLIIGAFGAWYYNTINDQIDQRLSGHPVPVRPNNPNPPSTSPAPATSVAANTDSNLAEKFADLQAQLQATQKRLAETEQATKALANRTQQAPTVPPPPAVAVAPALTPATPLTDDFLLLKERNRLTAYADEAIATANRAPYEQLWKSMDDPRLATLVHATRAEILRVQNYYLSGSRLDRFDIPVGDYYPDAAALRDTQLSDEQLIRLLGNPEHPWQVRLKAANLLGLRRSTTVGDALTKAIKSDPNLDVVKEATFSFEQLTGYRAQLFEIDTLESWWKQYTESPPPNAPPLTPEKPAKTAEKSADKTKEKAKEKPPTPEKKSSAPSDTEMPELKLPEELPTDS